MAGCCVKGCCNSSAKGYAMKRFPKNSEMRQKWINSMNYGNWQPPGDSRLCEVHFAPEMWEKDRVDGKRKLKCNAIPTIFNIIKTAVKRKKVTKNATPTEDLMFLKSVLTKPSVLLRQTSQKCQHSLKYSAMAEHSYAGNSLSVTLKRLQEFAPLKLASSWDNVGLLVDPMSDTKISNILLTNDLTEEVVEEAVQLKCEMVITYHPNIFQGMKSVSQKTWKERIVVQCIKNNIAVFSPHTSWDAVRGGVNDWLAASLPIKSSAPILKNADDPDTGAGRICDLEKPVSLKEAIRMIKDHIGIPHLRLALAKNQDESALIHTLAVCAGSGSSVLSGVDADLYLTGEMLHHDVLDAAQKGIHVILCNHSDSERGFLKVFQNKLQVDIMQGETQVFVSSVDKDPLKTV